MRRRLSYLAPVGRMALTNYPTYSLAYLVLFFGFGLGLTGRVGATGGARQAMATVRLTR